MCELRLEDVNRQLGLSQLYGPLQLTNLMESRTAPIHEDRGWPLQLTNLMESRTAPIHEDRGCPSSRRIERRIIVLALALLLLMRQPSFHGSRVVVNERLTDAA